MFWLGGLNARVSLPQWLVEFEATQTDLLDALLMGGSVGAGWLLLPPTVTPALCEEAPFRGYH